MYIDHISMYNEKVLKLPVLDSNLPFFVSAAGITYQNPNYRVHREKSDVTVIDYIIEGEGTAVIKNKTYHLKPGDTCLAMIDDEQLYYSNPDNPWKKIWVCFRGSLPPAIIDAYQLRNQTVFHCNTEKYLRHIHETLVDKLLMPTRINDKTALIFLELMQYLQAYITGETISPEAEIIKNHIDTHIYEPLKIEELAQLIYKSNAHAIRIFKNAYGITPYEYYNDNRIKKARDLLKITDMTIKEIAFSLGFTDEHYFSKMFKKKTGKSPTESRK